MKSCLAPIAFALLCATVILACLPGCGTVGGGNPKGITIVSNGARFTGDCVPNAIDCYKQLMARTPESKPRILLDKYSRGGATYGHCMTAFDWPPEGNPASVTYVWDADHQSMPIPHNIDRNDPRAIGEYMLPGTVLAWWADPSELETKL